MPKDLTITSQVQTNLPLDTDYIGLYKCFAKGDRSAKMLPLYLLTSMKGKTIMIELKDGETINGKLLDCDSRMNLTLTDATRIERTGTNAIHVPEIYVRGLQIKLVRISNEVIDEYKEQQNNQQNNQHNDRRNDGRRGNYQRNDGQGRRNNQRGGHFNRNYNNNNNNNNSNNNDRYQKNNRHNYQRNSERPEQQAAPVGNQN